MHIQNLFTRAGTLILKEPTRVKYTAASGRADWESDIRGELAGRSSSPYYTTQIPYVQNSKEIRIGYNITILGNYTFYNCRNLTSVTIPNSVTNIGQYAFGGCSGLTSVTIPDGVTSIGAYALQSCSSLTNVRIGSGVRSIGQSAFNGCNNALFDTITVSGVKLVDGWVVGTTSSPSGSLDLTGVRGICTSAFSGCSGLTNVTFSNSMTGIGQTAFYNCSGITGALVIPNNVTRIGNGAFRNCTSLTSVTIGDGVTSLPGIALFTNGIFAGCSSLTSVTIGSGLTHVGPNTFNGCSSCEVFDFRRVTVVPTLGGVTAFANTPSDKEIIVPDALYDEWVAATNWSSDTNNVRPCIVKVSQSSLGTL